MNLIDPWIIIRNGEKIGGEGRGLRGRGLGLRWFVFGVGVGVCVLGFLVLF